MYKILVDKRVEKQISSLHSKDQQKVIAAIDKLPKEFSKPQFSSRLKKLSGELNAWRWRAGGLRILFYKDRSKKVIRVYKVGYRGGIYS